MKIVADLKLGKFKKTETSIIKSLLALTNFSVLFLCYYVMH
jgi:hypothetical protein